MTTHRCDICSLPAAVATRHGWICRTCKRDEEYYLAHEQAVANVEFCPCGCARNQAGVCPSCAAEAARASYRYMAVHG